tara:strand:- start:4248 stop:4571 length:324 start_codon:yes stop_codon:yes gene_type:complete
MSKINPYDLPTEEERRVRITLTNLCFQDEVFRSKDAPTCPSTISVPVDSNLPEEEMVAKAIEIASAAIGYTIYDCDVEPIDYGSPKAPATEEAESLSDTLDYVGEIF